MYYYLPSQITWAGIDPIMRSVKAAATSNALPESTVARFSHPSFSQLMSEYLVAHVINAERNFYKVGLVEFTGCPT